MANPIQPAQLSWQHGDVPVAEAYGDVYFSAADGLAESRYVFQGGNGLPTRFATHPHPWLVVGETGFGSGLNMLALWQAWHTLPDPKANLHIISVDAHPMTQADMARAHAAWPELTEFSAELLASYPPPEAGKHRLYLAQGRVVIDLLWGDAAQQLATYAPAEGAVRVDAWMLDGFAPAKNPAMWHAGLYAALARLSHAGTTLATFTAAGHVRRGLEEAGFAVTRAKGFGHKRHMTTATFTAPLPNITVPNIAVPSAQPPAIVIGAGIAGMGAAWRLVQAGREVIVIEAGEGVAAGASGNPASALTPYYTLDWCARGRLYAAGALHTWRMVALLKARGHEVIATPCGVLQCAMTDEDAANDEARVARLGLPPERLRWVSAAEASELAGVPVAHPAQWHPQGGWLNMASLCTALQQDAGEKLTLLTRTTAQSMEHDGAFWNVALMGQCHRLRTDTLVLANAHAAAQLLPELKLQPVRGQLLQLPTPAALQGLRCVLNTGHYLTPPHYGRMVFGSTFRPTATDLDARTEDTVQLIESLRALGYATEDELAAATLSPWVGIRCATPQRLPLIGPAKGQPEGLFLHLAHGSRAALSGLFPLLST